MNHLPSGEVLIALEMQRVKQEVYYDDKKDKANCFGNIIFANLKCFKNCITAHIQMVLSIILLVIPGTKFSLGHCLNKLTYVTLSSYFSSHSNSLKNFFRQHSNPSTIWYGDQVIRKPWAEPGYLLSRSVFCSWFRYFPRCLIHQVLAHLLPFSWSLFRACPTGRVHFSLWSF